MRYSVWLISLTIHSISLFSWRRNLQIYQHRCIETPQRGYIPSYQQAYSVIWFTSSSLDVLVLVHWAQWLIHEGFFIETVTPYTHVKYNQFRKDFVDRTRHMKSLQIRKELHNKVRRNAHNTVIPAKALRVSPHPSASLIDLEEICVNKPEISLMMFSKAQLETQCRMYGLQLPSGPTKKAMSECLKVAVDSNACNPNFTPAVRLKYHSSSTRIQPDSNGDYICSKYGVLYLDDAMWIGCDISKCQLFMCRHCTELIDDQDNQPAIQQHWVCPFC